MNSKLTVTVLSLAAGIAASLAAGAAHADGIGLCTINALTVSGTYGFAGQGTATAAAAPFAPPGPLVQSGTVKQQVTSFSGSTLSGTWTVNLAQNDSVGVTPNVTFGGNFQINTTTCAGDFYVTTPLALPKPAFHVIVVSNGDELRTTSLIPGLFVVYSTAKKL